MRWEQTGRCFRSNVLRRFDTTNHVRGAVTLLYISVVSVSASAIAIQFTHAIFEILLDKYMQTICVSECEWARAPLNIHHPLSLCVRCSAVCIHDVSAYETVHVFQCVRILIHTDCVAILYTKSYTYIGSSTSSLPLSHMDFIRASNFYTQTRATYTWTRFHGTRTPASPTKFPNAFFPIFMVWCDSGLCVCALLCVCACSCVSNIKRWHVQTESKTNTTSYRLFNVRRRRRRRTTIKIKIHFGV